MHYDPFGFAKTTTTPAMTPGIATSGSTGSFANVGNATGAGDIETLFALYPAWSKNVQIPEQGRRVTPALAELAGSTAYTSGGLQTTSGIRYSTGPSGVPRQDSRPEEQLIGNSQRSTASRHSACKIDPLSGGIGVQNCPP